MWMNGRKPWTSGCGLWTTIVRDHEAFRRCSNGNNCTRELILQDYQRKSRFDLLVELILVMEDRSLSAFLYTKTSSNFCPGTNSTYDHTLTTNQHHYFLGWQLWWWWQWASSWSFWNWSYSDWALFMALTNSLPSSTTDPSGPFVIGTESWKWSRFSPGLNWTMMALPFEW